MATLKDSKDDEGKKSQQSGGQKAFTYFKQYCESTSIHGFKYLAEERSLGERLLWISLITLALSACGYLISNIYAKYTESPVIVSFATKESPIYTIPFPAVTVCPMTKAKKSIFNFTDIFRRATPLAQNETRYAKYMNFVCDNDAPQFANETYFTEDFYAALDEMKIGVDEFMLECKFMGGNGSCSDIFYPIILDESVCFTFNMLSRDDIFKSNVIKFSNYHFTTPTDWNIEDGYKYVEYVEYPLRAYLAGADNSLEITFRQKFMDVDYICRDVQGYSVVLHAPYSIPSLKKQFFFVPFDRVVNAVILPRVMSTSDKVKRYKPATRECYFSKEKNLKYFKLYSPKNCKLECLTNITLRDCGCVNFYMPRENGTQICGNAKRTCLKEAEEKLKEEQLVLQIDDNNMDFFCDCKPLCTDLNYEVEQSQAPVNYRERIKAMGMKQVVDDDEYYTKLSIFFKQDSFLTSERNELYGPTDFLANFGGLLGLFTGFSLLSAAEILYFLTIRLCCNFRLFRRWVPEE